MAGWTKQDFDANYSIRVERYMGGHPNTRPEVRLSYHRVVMLDFMRSRWSRLIPDVLDIQQGDFVVLIGGAFGWSGEVIQELTGATAISVDPSDWIAATKNTDESVEVVEAVRKVGLDPTTGRGLEIMQKHSPTGPRAQIPVIHADVTTQRGLQKVLDVAPKIDWIITEDVVRIFDDAYKRTFSSALDKLNATNVIHLKGREVVR